VSKNVVGNNKTLLILGTCVGGTIRIMLGLYLKNNVIYVDINSEKTEANTYVYSILLRRAEVDRPLGR
jgi:hypothetical protein